VLKSQINPHFMFNSLNVLSGLIAINPQKAQQFVDAFSMVYRYILETIERPVVSLREELDFLRDYMYLQQMRYGENLHIRMDLPSEVLQGLLPPLSLQTVVENAIKHNIVSPEAPLQITLNYEAGALRVVNKLQPKLAGGKSTGVGQKNLKKRYALISNLHPRFRVAHDTYTAVLPLITQEDARTDY